MFNFFWITFFKSEFNLAPNSHISLKLGSKHKPNFILTSNFTTKNSPPFVFPHRSLYYKKGFELIGSYQKRFVAGLVGLNMFRLSKKLNEESSKNIFNDDED